jgi:CheY-like chemotaxis protein
VKTILIIEDDAVTAHTYKKALQKGGYEVDHVGDGQAGLERIQQLRPDAVLLDLMMPKLGGIALLKLLRAMPDFAALPVVAYTNAYVPQMVDDAKAAGANQVLSKSTMTAQSLAAAFREELGGS